MSDLIEKSAGRAGERGAGQEVGLPRKIEVHGVRFDDVDLDEAADIVAEFAARSGEGRCRVVHTPNAEIVQLCVEQPDNYALINSADLIIPDGAGVVLAAKILGRPLAKGKVAGIDLAERTLASAAQSGAGVFFLGGKPASDEAVSVAEEAAEKMTAKYPGLRVVGCHDGYFAKEGRESDAVVEEINASGAAILFVCLGVPAQEMWMARNRAHLRAGVALGLGGSLDVFAGRVNRAPQAFIRLNLEWLYRLIKEPSRLGRMMKLPKFLLGTLLARLRGGEKEKKKK